MVHFNAVDVMKERLSGQFQDDNMNGTGTYHFADGRNYTGDWIEGKKTGHGVFIWTNGDCYKM
jgi:hypothetical protein